MITVYYFASVRENLGLESETLKLPQDVASVSKLIDHLVGSRDGKWRSTLADGAVMVAVNQTVASKSTPITAGDEIAFFPPVTGG